MVMKCHESIGYAKFIWKIMFCDYVQMISTALMISRHPFRLCCEILLGADYLKMTIYIRSL